MPKNDAIWNVQDSPLLASAALLLTRANDTDYHLMELIANVITTSMFWVCFKSLGEIGQSKLSVLNKFIITVSRFDIWMTFFHSSIKLQSLWTIRTHHIKYSRFNWFSVNAEIKRCLDIWMYIRFSVEECSCVVMTAMLWVCFKSLGEIGQSKLSATPWISLT